MSHLQSAGGRKALFIGLAFVLQGAWAAYVSWSHGPAVWLRAALLHGLLCAGMTLISTSLMESLFALVGNPALGFVCAVLGTALIMLGGAALVHVLNGTPSIAATMAPLIAIGIPFYCSYCLLIWRARSQV